MSLLLVLAFSLSAAAAPPTRFPAKIWEKRRPANWSEAKLQAARQYASTIQTAAVMIIQDGAIVDSWGDLDKKYLCHSMRKSFLSALYGQAVAEGKVDVAKSLADLGIDDNEPALTAQEKQATILDLLKARSGIYHPSLAGTATMKAVLPLRGSHAPGTFWVYNNWDFNALGTIYTKLTGENIHESFARRIAQPIGMEHYAPADGSLTTGPDSIHSAYPFKMSTKDLARFGLLYLNKGQWNGRQIVPAKWVEESTQGHSDASTYNGDRYGYMWWVDEHSYSARGAGGHHLTIVPAMNLIVVHRVDTFDSSRSVSGTQYFKLLDMIVDAAGRGDLKSVAQSKTAPPCHQPTVACAERLYLGPKSLTYYRSHSLQFGTHPGVKRAYVMVHGAARNGDAYYGTAMASAAAAGKLQDTAIVAPHFRANAGGCRDAVEPSEYAWTCEDWKVGAPAANSGGTPAHSFDFIDSFVKLLNNKTRFPNLEEIIIGGHSAGGQFIQRYAAMTTTASALPVRYFVANPSSYLYLNPLRLSRQGSCDTKGNCQGRFTEYWDRKDCTTFNTYKHGLDNLTGYAATIGAEKILAQFPKRNVTYLVGALDVNQDSDLETTCNAMAQGFNRRERGIIFWNFMRQQYQADHKIAVINGCGHSATCMFASPATLPLLFGK